MADAFLCDSTRGYILLTPTVTCWSRHPPYLWTTRSSLHAFHRWTFNPQIEEITRNSRVCLLAEDVSAPLSLPARSIRENFPWTLSVPGIRAVIWKTAWDRDELEFALVWPLVLALFPCCINFNTSSQVSTTFSVNPSICTYGTGKDRNELNGKREQVNAYKRTCCLPSSRTRSFSLSFNRSNTLPE